MTTIILTSPLSGWAAPLDEVPDPVFAGRMLGDGVAIDPTGSILHAPCDGIVVDIHASRHAITLRNPEGAEILMHIGIDTVALGGNGFVARVAEGDAVSRGDPLLEFDLDDLLARVPAVVTPILVTNGDAFAIVRRYVDREIAVGEALMTLVPRDGADAVTVAGAEHRRRIAVPMVHGIHARPAGRIAECTRAFRAEIGLHKDGRRANARSPVAMLTLGVKLGDAIEVVATGEDAEAALAAVCDMIAGGMGESGGGFPPAREVAARGARIGAGSPADRIRGVTAAPGQAVGAVRWLRTRDRDIAETGASPAIERARLGDALAAAIAGLAAGTGAAGTIIEAHRALLDDPDLRARAERLVDEGRSADWAWRAALRAQARMLRSLGDARLAERADDLLDVERQVLAALAGETIEAPGYPPDTILLAEDLLPSDLIRLGPGGVAGVCTARGGPTSHVAILAAGMNIPAVVAAGPGLLAVAEGVSVILDAEAATLDVAPSPARLAGARATIADDARHRQEALDRAMHPATMRDGRAIEVFANLGSVAEARLAVRNGAEGCGLLRTEFLFLDRPQAPGEQEQAAEYQAIADALAGRPLIVRLLDIGGDKPAAYLPMAVEDNPALGLRGIRVGLAHRYLLDTQLRAILRVRPLGQCRIMVPMVASVAELLAVRAALDAAKEALGIEAAVELGVMIETPAAAVTADLIGRHADFLSIGTNDLTQYVLAMDRGNAAVAPGIDGLHPAVLRAIAQTCDGGARIGRWTGVCGGLASDPLAIPILIGLGITELSATPALVPEVKAIVRTLSLDDCQRLAEEALRLASAEDVRDLAKRFRQEQSR